MSVRIRLRKLTCISLLLSISGTSTAVSNNKFRIFGETISVVEVNNGATIPFGTLLVTPKRSDKPDGYILLGIDRSYVNPDVPRVLFEGAGCSNCCHPFLGRGIETKFYNNLVTVKIYSGVVFTFRNGKKCDAKNSISIVDSVNARVISSNGDSVRSIESVVDLLPELYLLERAPATERKIRTNVDGSIEISSEFREQDRPPFFTPKLIDSNWKLGSD